MDSYAKTPQTDPDSRSGCLVSRHDLEILLASNRAEPEEAQRNLFAGIAVSSGFGCLGILASHFGELFSVGIGPIESFFLVVLIATTLAATALTIFFQQRVRQAGTSEADRVLRWHLQDQIDQPPELADPRRWP